MYSYSTRVCHNLSFQKKKERKKKVQYTETQIEISCVNELFGGAHIHLDCTLHSSNLPHPFAFTAFRLTASFALKKV